MDTQDTRKKDECVDANWHIFAVLVILNCTKYGLKSATFVVHGTLFRKQNSWYLSV